MIATPVTLTFRHVQPNVTSVACVRVPTQFIVYDGAERSLAAPLKYVGGRLYRDGDRDCATYTSADPHVPSTLYLQFTAVFRLHSRSTNTRVGPDSGTDSGVA